MLLPRAFLASLFSLAIGVGVSPAQPRQPLEGTILAQSHSIIGEGFDSTAYRILEGSILELPVKYSNPKVSTYIDLRSGKRLLGNTREHPALRVFDFDPAEDLAIVADSEDRWRTITASSNTTIADFTLRIAPQHLAITSQGRRIIAFSAEPTGYSLQALDPTSGQESWSLSLPTGSHAELTKDRSRIRILRADPTRANARFLELYEPMNGDLIASVDLADALSDGLTTIQSHSNDGRYAVLRRSANTEWTLIDIEANSTRILDTDLLAEISADSRFAIMRDGSIWHVIKLENASAVHSVTGGALARPSFTSNPNQILYYDEPNHELRHVDLTNSGTSVALKVPAELATFMFLGSTSDDRFFALGGFNDNIYIFDTSTDSVTAVGADLSTFSSYGIDTSSERLIAVGVSGAVGSLSLSSPVAIEALAQESAQRIAVSGAKNQISVLFSHGRVQRYEASTLELIDENVLQVLFADRIYDIASDAPLIVFQTVNELRIANYESQEVVWSRPLTGGSVGIIDATLSTSGRYIAIRSFDPFSPEIYHNLEVIDTSNAALVFESQSDAQNLWQPTFSANESIFSFANRDETDASALVTYQLPDGSLKSTSPSFQPLNDFVLTADGSRAFAASGSSVFEVDLSSGGTTTVSDADGLSEKDIRNLSVSPNQSHAVVTDQDRNVHLLDLRTGRHIASVRIPWANSSFGGSFFGFLPDSNSFLSSNTEGSFSIWKILSASRKVKLSISAPHGRPTVVFETFAGRGYRISESADLSAWTSTDPFHGGTASADAFASRHLLPSTQAFLEAWEYIELPPDP